MGAILPYIKRIWCPWAQGVGKQFPRGGWSPLAPLHSSTLWRINSTPLSLRRVEEEWRGK